MAVDHRNALVCSGTVVWESDNGHLRPHHFGTAICIAENSARVYE